MIEVAQQEIVHIVRTHVTAHAGGGAGDLDEGKQVLALDVDADAGEAWVAVRRPGRVGALLGVDLTSGALISETPVSLPAGVRLTAERAWVTDYERDELVEYLAWFRTRRRSRR